MRCPSENSTSTVVGFSKAAPVTVTPCVCTIAVPSGFTADKGAATRQAGTQSVHAKVCFFRFMFLILGLLITYQSPAKLL